MKIITTTMIAMIVSFVMVPPRELESRTLALSRRCSNQLSYGGIIGTA